MARRGEGEARVFLFCLSAVQGTGTAENRCSASEGEKSCDVLVIRAEMDKQNGRMILLQLARSSGSVFNKWHEGASGKPVYFYFVYELHKFGGTAEIGPEKRGKTVKGGIDAEKG